VLQRLITPTKAAALLLVALALLTFGGGTQGAFAAPMEGSPPALAAFCMALAAVLWPFEGVVAASAVAGETTDPGRTLPRALVGSVVAVAVLYLLVNLGLLHVLPLDAVANSKLVVADAMRIVAGAPGAAFVAACAVLATFGALMSSAMADPRVFFAMARDRLFFSALGAVHARFRTPHLAVILSACLAVLYVWVRTFEQLAVGFVMGMWLFYAMAVVGLLKLRRTRPDLPRPYRVFLYPFTPIAFLAGSGVLVGSVVAESPFLVLTNVLILLAGVPAYLVWRKVTARG
jgi:amino acid transporter